MLAGNLAHGLQETQLQRYRLLAHHRGGLHHFFRGLKFALSVDYLSAAFALGLGLLGHGALHRVRQRYILHLDRRDFDAPWFGLPVDNLLQLLVDGFALRQQVIEWGLAEDAAQRGLGDKRSGLKKILHLHDSGLRIDHAEIDDGIDRDRHVVTRHHFLSLDVDGDDAQIHSHHAIDDRNEKNQSRPFGAEQLAETENHPALVLSQDADHLRQEDYGEENNGN